MPVPKKIKEIKYMISKVTDKDKRNFKGMPDINLWNIQVKNAKLIESRGTQTLHVDLDPGLYVVTFFGWWTDLGDATHGFLLKVTPN